jgi:hypothetical protein
MSQKATEIRISSLGDVPTSLLVVVNITRRAETTESSESERATHPKKTEAPSLTNATSKGEMNFLSLKVR